MRKNYLQSANLMGGLKGLRVYHALFKDQAVAFSAGSHFQAFGDRSADETE